MIDLHCHVLPGIDDGAPTWEETLEFGKVAAREGLLALVATPHWDIVSETAPPAPSVSQIRELCARAETLWGEHGLEVRLYPGAEIRIAMELPELYQAGELPVLGGVGAHLLIELPYHHIPPFTEEILFRLKLDGATAVIAHPERTRDITDNVDHLARLVDLGHEVALDAGSLLGEGDGEIRGAAEEAISRGLVTYVVSDAHQAQDLKRLKQCRRRIDRLAGRGSFHQMTALGPVEILQAQRA